jgi:hypothetical protein
MVEYKQILILQGQEGQHGNNGAMNHSLIKRIALVSLSGFFLAICAVAFHYHDNKFLRTSRSICKVKSSISGTMSKKQVDSAPAVAIVSLGLEAAFPLLATVIHQNTTIFISSQVDHTFPNKAPPVRS